MSSCLLTSNLVSIVPYNFESMSNTKPTTTKKYAHFRHIILDMDNTLMCGAPNTQSVPADGYNPKAWFSSAQYFRPGLLRFLSFCFSHFDSVSIWTAGKQDWLQLFLDTLEEKQPGITKKFLFTWDWRYVTQDRRYQQYGLFYQKQLEKMWNHKKGKEAGMTPTNVCLLDDSSSNEYTYPNNFVLSNAWEYYHIGKDDHEFERLIALFENTDEKKETS